MWRIPAIVLALVPLAASAAPAYFEASGAIRVVGYADMSGLLEAWDASDAAIRPDLRFDLQLVGTRAAPAALAGGTSAFAPMGAAFTAEQLRAYVAAVGRRPIGIRVARDTDSPRAKSGPLVVIVNSASPIAALSDAEVARIFTTGEWNHHLVPIVGLAPSTTVLGEMMQTRLLHGCPFAPTFRGYSESDAVVAAVSRDPACIGFARSNVVTPAVRIVASYERYLYLYVRDLADPIARNYLEVALSAAGQGAVARSPLGYRPLDAAELAAEMFRIRHPPPRFIHVDAFDFRAMLPPPPAAGSLCGQADLDVVLQVQAWRSADQIQFAREVSQAPTFLGLLERSATAIVGRWFTPDRFPDVTALAEQVVFDMDPMEAAAKRAFPRSRPYRADPRVHPCIELPTGDSYPSGHAAYAYVWAATLAEIFPADRNALLQRAHAIAWARVISGVHYPSDLAAGRMLGAALMRQLDRNPDFRAAVERCREEVEPYLAKQAG